MTQKNLMSIGTWFSQTRELCQKHWQLFFGIAFGLYIVTYGLMYLTMGTVDSSQLMMQNMQSFGDAAREQQNLDDLDFDDRDFENMTEAERIAAMEEVFWALIDEEVWSEDMMSIGMQSGWNNLTPLAIAWQILIFLITVVVSIMLTMIVAQKKDHPRKNIDTQDLLVKSLKLFFPLIWLSILLVLGVLGGMIFLIIPGIYLMIRRSMANTAMILDGHTIMWSLRESARLIKGRRREVFGRFLLLFLAAIIIGAVLWFIIGLIIGLVWWSFATMTVFVDIIVSPIATVLVTAAIIILYHDLKVTAVSKEIVDE